MYSVAGTLVDVVIIVLFLFLFCFFEKKVHI